MTTTPAPETLRERTRRAVRNELLDVAQGLFAEKGYEQVTVDEIAESAGISRRSFFRYFGSKDDLVLGKYDRQGEDFVDALRARPADEPAWTSLRRMFDGVVAYMSDPDLGRRAAEINRVIHASPTLHAGYLQRMNQAQDLVAQTLRARDESLTPVAASALVAAAFGALTAAHRATQDSDTAFADALDAAMAAISAGAA